MTPPPLSLRSLALTAVAMVFFAANSLLARFALGAGEIDAGNFTLIRILAGAITLALLFHLGPKPAPPLWSCGSWPAALFLLGYAILFSFAYLSLSAGTGALTLFAAVQVTMFGAAIRKGYRPHRAEALGWIFAFSGLVYLLAPGLEAPPLQGLLLMAASGVCWGLYSLSGTGVAHPTVATAGNFLRAAPMALLFTSLQGHTTPKGILLATLSGSLTSGVGYAIWYSVLKDLGPTRAATIQLTVPAIAAASGVLLLGETLTLRLVFAATAILGGVATALSLAKSRQSAAPK